MDDMSNPRISPSPGARAADLEACEVVRANLEADQTTKGTHEGGLEGGIHIKVAVFAESEEPQVDTLRTGPWCRASLASELFTQGVMLKVHELGGVVPEAAVRELMYNLVHANFENVVVTIMDKGNAVRISDKGPGIRDKERAFKFGYSGASSAALREIRGIGAGLGIAQAAAEKVGGTVTVDDNIGSGTVATVAVSKLDQAAAADKLSGSWPMSLAMRKTRIYPSVDKPTQHISRLTGRQQEVLLVVFESEEEVGPSTVAEKLGVSVSTAYRDLSVLEEHGLVTGAEAGKRAITPLGQDVVKEISEKRGEWDSLKRLALENERKQLSGWVNAVKHRLDDISVEISREDPN